MAGGKMSPRQKMINMMYLVLLALLALNVSAEILAAFENIRKQLQTSVASADENQTAFVNGMKKEIAKEISEGNKRNVTLADSLDLVREKTGKMIGEIDRHIDSLVAFGGIDEITGLIVDKGQTETNYQYFMGKGDLEYENEGRGSGAAKGLRDQFDEYATWLSEVYNKQLKKSVPDSMRKTPELIENPAETLDGDVKTWERYNFEGPLVANLATLEAMKIDVYRQEKELLDILNTRLGVVTFKVDKVVAIDAPTAKIVPAGLQFETKLYVAMSSSMLKPTFSSHSGKIEKIDGGNAATLKMGANGRVIPKGKKEGKQTYTASISVPKATGGRAVLPVKGEFIVRLPEVVVTSATVQNLYRRCGNAINIDVPALGEFYTPKVTASQATINQSGKSKTKFLIVPTGKTCVVGVSSLTNGQTLKIGDVKYKVIEPPKPSIDMRINGKPTSGANPVSKKSRVTVQMVPDPEFRAALPNDARYGISNVEVLAALSLGPPVKVGGANLSGKDATKPISIPMGTKVKRSSPGTKVYIRLDDIFRRNFQGKTVVDKRFSEVERTLSFVVK